MLIDPDFLDHWRTRALVDALGGDELAPLYLIRLWSHCQIRKSDTFEIPTAGLKSLCRFSGRAETLESALIETGWVERDGRNLRACKWLEKNSGMVSRWENGKSGGRPKKPDGNRSETEPKPAGTSGEPIGQDRTRQDKKNPPTPLRGEANDGDGSFDAWWRSYPIRGPGVPRGNKAKAFRAWAKLGDADRAKVVEATRRLVASGQMPKDAERFLQPPGRGGGDPPWRVWLEDAGGAAVASAGKSTMTAAERKDALCHAEDGSWLSEK